MRKWLKLKTLFWLCFFLRTTEFRAIFVFHLACRAIYGQITQFSVIQLNSHIRLLHSLQSNWTKLVRFRLLILYVCVCSLVFLLLFGFNFCTVTKLQNIDCRFWCDSIDNTKIIINWFFCDTKLMTTVQIVYQWNNIHNNW